MRTVDIFVELGDAAVFDGQKYRGWNSNSIATLHFYFKNMALRQPVANDVTFLDNIFDIAYSTQFSQDRDVGTLFHVFARKVMPNLDLVGVQPVYGFEITPLDGAKEFTGGFCDGHTSSYQRFEIFLAATRE
jgi:hypothetical protein